MRRLCFKYHFFLDPLFQHKLQLHLINIKDAKIAPHWEPRTTVQQRLVVQTVW